MGTTHFNVRASVDVWDTWFRWRVAGELRDLTIDATWQRVADAIASSEPSGSSRWATQFSDAFAQWKLLPGERLLCNAGTGNPIPANAANQAVLNAGAFVRRTGNAAPHFDRGGFFNTAVLAVRMLDDALHAARHSAEPVEGLRIGLIGVADALALLGLDYASIDAQSLVREMAAALAEGCIEGTLALAHDRGPIEFDRHRTARHWRARGVGADTLARIQRVGIRHANLTAIDSQSRLAMLANNAADAIDPRTQDELLKTEPIIAQTAQLAMRATIQSWIDRPIDYPLLAVQDLDAATRAHCATFARARKLKPPSWRRP